MHEFSVGQRRIGRPNPEDDRLMGMPAVESERTVRLSGILGRVGSKAIYTYDFGDSWEHSLVLEKRLPRIRTPPIPSARIVSLHVHRKIVEASPDSVR